MTPRELSIPVPGRGERVVFSHPAYLAAEVEETPYQLLQICAAHHKCATLVDERGGGGISLSSDKTLAFSPDGQYFLALRQAGVNLQTREIRQQYFQIFGVREAGTVVFRTASGKEAASANILGWLPDQAHALEISTGWKKTAPAYPLVP